MKKLKRGLALFFAGLMFASVACTADTKVTEETDFTKPVQITLKNKVNKPEQTFKLLSKDKKEIPYILNKLDDKNYVLAPLALGEGMKLSANNNIAKVSQYKGEIFVQSKENLAKITKQVEQQMTMFADYGKIGERAEEAAPAAENKIAAGAPSAKAKSGSETNVQVQGVDEADIVKVSGDYIYYSTYNKIFVAKANGGKPEQVRLMDFGTEYNVSDMYATNNRLIVVGNAIKNNKSYTKTIVYDVANPGYPKALRSFSQEGNYISSRKIGNQIYVITQTYLGNNTPMPMYIDSVVSSKEQSTDLNKLRIFPPYNQSSVVTISSMDISNKEKADYITYIGDAGDLYMSQESLYISYRENNYWYDPVFRGTLEEQPIVTEVAPSAIPPTPIVDGKKSKVDDKLVPEDDQVIDITDPDAYLDKTVIKKFSVKGSSIQYVNEAKIVGTLINQFAMDESKGYFRVAYTRDSSSGSEVAVFDKNMNPVGQLSKIAPGERIYSVRFMGDKLYMVTFKQVDPFFVIDMKKPAEPKMLGYLKIPGYSNYLHPYDENYIIGFGNDTKEGANGNIQNAGMKIAMFDVTDVSKPKQLSNVVIGSMGTYSDLMYNHKALLYNKEQSYFGFPVTVTQKGKDPQNPWEYDTVFQGGYLYRVGKNYQLEFMGKTTHRTSKEWDWNQMDQIQRLVYVGDYIYSLSNKGISANQVKDMKETKMLQWKE